MRRVVLFISSLLTIFVLSPGIIIAGNTNAEIPPEVLERKRIKMEQRILEKQKLLLQKQEQILEKAQIRNQIMATRQARLSETRKENIRRFYNHIKEKYLAMIERLNVLISRIETRIAEIESEENINLTYAKSEVARAKGLLEEAKADITAVDNTIDETLNSTDPKGSFQIIKDALLDIKKKLVEIHKILVKVIGNIKGLRVGQNKPSPTQIPTVTPTQTI